MIVKDILSYSIAPVYVERRDPAVPLKVAKTLILVLVLNLSLSVLPVFLLVALGFSPDNHVKNTLTYGWAFNLLIVTLLGPLLEETAFRLSLRYDKWNLFFTSTVLSYFIVNLVLSTKNYDFSNHLFERLAIPVCIGAAIYFVAYTTEVSLIKLWKHNFRAIYYLFAVLFAFAHAGNFGSVAWFLVPLVTFPQLMSAFILGYVRMHYGFWACLFVHALHNGIPEMLKF